MRGGRRWRDFLFLWIAILFSDRIACPCRIELHLDRSDDAGQKAGKGPAGVIGPDGEWIAQCAQTPEPGLVVASLDRNDPAYDIPLQKARPWRAKARQGHIYREKLVDDPRSHNRDEY